MIDIFTNFMHISFFNTFIHTICVYILCIYCIYITIFIKIKDLCMKLIERTINKSCVKMTYDMSSFSRDGILCRNTYQVFNTQYWQLKYILTCQELLILHSFFSLFIDFNTFITVRILQEKIFPVQIQTCQIDEPVCIVIF